MIKIYILFIIFTIYCLHIYRIKQYFYKKNTIYLILSYCPQTNTAHNKTGDKTLNTILGYKMS